MERLFINEKNQEFEKFVEKIRGFKLSRAELKEGLEIGEIEIIKSDLGLSEFKIKSYFKQILENKKIRLRG